MDKRVVDAAYDALGSNLQPMSVSQMPSSSQQVIQQPTSQVEPPSFQQSSLSNEVVNGGVSYEEEGPGVSRLRQMFQQGDTTKEITTETSKQQIGGTTITKVKREEITHSGVGPSLSPYPIQEQRGQSPRTASSGSHSGVGPSLSPYPIQEPRGQSPRTTSPMFQVSNNIGSGTKKPGVWAPSGQVHKPVSGQNLKVTAPSAVNVAHNPDKSVTMSFGIDSKENIAPQINQPQQQQPKAVPSFNVKKNVTGAPPAGPWQPATSVPVKHQQAPIAPAPLQQQAPENTEDFTHFPFEAPTWRAKDPSQMDTSDPFVDDNIVNVHLAKILHEGPGSDYESGNESPGTFWTKKSMFCFQFCTLQNKLGSVQ